MRLGEKIIYSQWEKNYHRNIWKRSARMIKVFGEIVPIPSIAITAFNPELKGMCPVSQNASASVYLVEISRN